MTDWMDLGGNLEGVRERVEGGADECGCGNLLLLLLKSGLWMRELLLLLPCV